MKKNNKTINVRPDQNTCINCKDHGICEAEKGTKGYQCSYIVCKNLRESV